MELDRHKCVNVLRGHANLNGNFLLFIFYSPPDRKTHTLVLSCPGEEGDLYKGDTIHAAISRSHSALLTLITLGSKQVAVLLVVLDLPSLLIPDT